jgi:hypothetical protein
LCLERLFLIALKKIAKGNKQFKPVVARIIIGRVDIPRFLLMGRSAAESESDEDIEEICMVIKYTAKTSPGIFTLQMYFLFLFIPN